MISSIAALFFFSDSYALILTYFSGLLEMSFLYRAFPLIFIIPLGIFMGTRLFKGSTRESYKKYVLYFLIVVSIFGLIKSVIQIFLIKILFLYLLNNCLRPALITPKTIAKIIANEP